MAVVLDAEGYEILDLDISRYGGKVMVVSIAFLLANRWKLALS